MSNLKNWQNYIEAKVAQQEITKSRLFTVMRDKQNELEEELSKYKSLVKTVDPDNLPGGEVVITLDKRIESGNFDNLRHPVNFNERDGYFDLMFVELEDYPIHYIEQKDLIALITGVK